MTGVTWTTPQPAAGSEFRGTFSTSGISGQPHGMQVLVNWLPGIQGGCYIGYSVAQRSISMFSDTEDAWLPAETLSPGAQDIIGDKCTLEVSKTSASVTANIASLTLSILFNRNFVGANNFYAMNLDSYSNASWQPLLTYTMYPASMNPPVSPAAGDVTPASPNGSGAAIRFHLSDDNGYGYISQVMVQVGDPSVSGCMFMYYPLGNGIDIFNDAGTNWVQDRGLGTPGTVISKSQCALDVSNAKKSASGNDLYVTLPLLLLPRYTGSKSVRILGIWDRSGNPGLYSNAILGTWTSGASTYALSPRSAMQGGAGAVGTFTVSATPSTWSWVAKAQPAVQTDPYNRGIFLACPTATDSFAASFRSYLKLANRASSGKQSLEVAAAMTPKPRLCFPPFLGNSRSRILFVYRVSAVFVQLRQARCLVDGQFPFGATILLQLRFAGTPIERGWQQHVSFGRAVRAARRNGAGNAGEPTGGADLLQRTVADERFAHGDNGLDGLQHRRDGCSESCVRLRQYGEQRQLA